MLDLVKFIFEFLGLFIEFFIDIAKALYEVFGFGFIVAVVAVILFSIVWVFGNFQDSYDEHVKYQNFKNIKNISNHLDKMGKK